MTARNITCGASFLLALLIGLPLLWAWLKPPAEWTKPVFFAVERDPEPNTVGVGFCSDCLTVVVLERDTLTARCACGERQLLGRVQALEDLYDMPAYGEIA